VPISSSESQSSGLGLGRFDCLAGCSGLQAQSVNIVSTVYC